MDITRLIEGCKRGESLSQRKLFELYTPLLYSVSLRYAVDRGQAKDILQDAWINIFNGLIKYNHQGKLEGWMSRIVINIALRKLSSKEIQNQVYTSEFYDAPSEEPKVLTELHYDDLLRLVNQLPEVSREIFKMAAIDGLKHKEIAEMMGIEESTSRVHLTRARKKLQELIKNLEKVELYGQG